MCMWEAATLLANLLSCYPTKHRTQSADPSIDVPELRT